jgi:broad specificity phosphatase PhoE
LLPFASLIIHSIMRPSPILLRSSFKRSSPLLQEWKISSPKAGSAASIPRLPKHILLLRHGQSLGNVDQNLFTIMPDWKIPLSEKGKAQAREAGHRIQAIARDSPLVVYYSPYLRTKETFQEVKSVLKNPVLFTREEPRLREQDFGNFQDRKAIQEAKLERPQFGRFFYRFPNGESGADVFDRVSAFCGTFRQDMEQIAYSRSSNEKDPDSEIENSTALFVTHGITARLFLMRWLHWSVDEFEQLQNPPNCGLLHLYRDGSAYRLSRESTALIKAPGESGGALQLGEQLLERRRRRKSSDREAFAALAESAWGT